MKNFTLLFTGMSLLSLFVFTSCKKDGCKDELAVNFRSKANKDDGSCIYSTTKIAGQYKYIWNDTIADTVDVFSVTPSYMKISNGTFDEMLGEIQLVIDWPNLTGFVPDSLAPEDGKITGKITNKESFTIQYTQEIPLWSNPTLFKDTIYNYAFTKI